jgi:nitrite reductase/ring-hydroxylating ferredoxin subunit
MPTWRIPGVRPPEPGHAIRVDVSGTPVAVFNVGDRLLAVDARCTHVGGPLDKGRVSGTVVTCPLHGSEFDLESGKVVRGPAMRPVRAYRARAEADALVLDSD